MSEEKLALGSASSDLQRARAASEALKVQDQQLRLQVRRGELVDRKAAVQHVKQLAATEREALERFPADRASVIAAHLGVDEGAVLRVLEAQIRDHLELRAGVRIDIAPKV